MVRTAKAVFLSIAEEIGLNRSLGNEVSRGNFCSVSALSNGSLQHRTEKWIHFSDKIRCFRSPLSIVERGKPRTLFRTML